MTIHILPPDIRQRIAAGEVIERPASIVKELIENAVDAGARAISIEVRDGGLGLIRVSDDGCGMGRADAQLCTTRFATSKIHTTDDLHGICTLGFRGEALSSIVAVGHVEILTRASDEIEGTRVHAREGGTEIEPAASPLGTSVTVRGIFAHLPARRRFLKSRLREAELIQKTVVGFALAYPQVAFRLTFDGQERLAAPRATPIERIGAILGRDVVGEMTAIEWHALDLRIQGFVSRPTIGRSRRSTQYFFVNGRPIQPGLLAVMLERPYSGRLVPGRHPLAVIHIAMDPQYVDVNVHPRKAEVRFAHERTVYTALTHAVIQALQEYPLGTQESSIPWPFGGWTEATSGQIDESTEAYGTIALRALAQLHYTYILAQTYDGLAIADQHAAHEQVLFEQLVQGSERVELSTAVRVSLTPHEMTTFEHIAPLLGSLGIEIEPFGGLALLVRTLPRQLEGTDPAEVVTALIEEAASDSGPADEVYDRLAMKAACLGAVKAGDPLTLDQMQHLLDSLSQAWSPATCPHGRPAIVSISMEELAQRFSRHTIR